jgi:hypothetical protein
MTITIDLPPATLEKLKAEAAATGKDIQTVVCEAVEARFARRRETFAEILKPIQDEVEASGTSEQELEDQVDEAVADARAQRRATIKRAQLDKSTSELARKHYQVESGLTRVIHFSGAPTAEFAAPEPIKLLEVNTNTVPSGVMPLGFGPAPEAGIRFPSVIIEVTPEEFEKIEAKELPLPSGWEFKQREIPRPADAVESK